MNLPSNHPVPIQNQMVTVEQQLDATGAQLAGSAARPTATASFRLPGSENATQIAVNDRFGNSTTLAIAVAPGIHRVISRHG